MFIARAMCGITSAKVAALCSIGSLQKYLERWAAALSEERRSVSMVMTRPTITTVELHTFHLYQHYSLFTRNKLQYTWLEGLLRACAACPTPLLNLRFELRPTWNKHPRYLPYRDRAGCNKKLLNYVYINLMFFWPCVMNWLYNNYQLDELTIIYS